MVRDHFFHAVMIASGSCPWKCKESTGAGRRRQGKSPTAQASGSFDGPWVTSDLEGIVVKMQIKI